GVSRNVPDTRIPFSTGSPDFSSPFMTMSPSHTRRIACARIDMTSQGEFFAARRNLESGLGTGMVVVPSGKSLAGDVCRGVLSGARGAVTECARDEKKEELARCSVAAYSA